MATYDAAEVLGRVSRDTGLFFFSFCLSRPENLPIRTLQLVNESLLNQISISGTSLARAANNRTFELDTGNIVMDKFGERLLNHCVSDFDVTSKQFEVFAAMSLPPQKPFRLIDLNFIFQSLSYYILELQSSYWTSVTHRLTGQVKRTWRHWTNHCAVICITELFAQAVYMNFSKHTWEEFIINDDLSLQVGLTAKFEEW